MIEAKTNLLMSLLSQAQGATEKTKGEKAEVSLEGEKSDFLALLQKIENESGEASPTEINNDLVASVEDNSGEILKKFKSLGKTGKQEKVDQTLIELLGKTKIEPKEIELSSEEVPVKTKKMADLKIQVSVPTEFNELTFEGNSESIPGKKIVLDQIEPELNSVPERKSFFPMSKKAQEAPELNKEAQVNVQGPIIESISKQNVPKEKVAALLEKIQLPEKQTGLGPLKELVDIKNEKAMKIGDASPVRKHVELFTRTMENSASPLIRVRDESISKEVKDLMPKETKKTIADFLLPEKLSPVTEIGSKSIELQKNNELPVKVMNMSDSSIKSESELISKISDYIAQGRIQNRDGVQLVVRDEGLGQFEIQVNKSKGNTVDLKIVSDSDPAKTFFHENESSLLSGLQKVGVKVSDFKVVSGDSFKAFAGQSSNSGESFGGRFSEQSSSGQGQSYQQGRFSGQSQDGAERRKMLWEEYRERYSA